MRVSEGRDDEPLLAGQVYIAPGGTHMRIGGTLPILAFKSSQIRLD